MPRGYMGVLKPCQDRVKLALFHFKGANRCQPKTISKPHLRVKARPTASISPSPPNEPCRHGHRDVEESPDGAENPIRRIPRWLGQARVPSGDVRRGGEGPDASSRKADDEENDEGDNLLYHCSAWRRGERFCTIICDGAFSSGRESATFPSLRLFARSRHPDSLGPHPK